MTLDRTQPDLTAITTPFGLLDDATQEALRAHGGPYDCYEHNGWHEAAWPTWRTQLVYRVKPAPKVEAVTQDAWIDQKDGETFFDEIRNGTPVRVTFNRIDGVIDLSSYRLEARQ